ncbi:ALF repeat-containing protein [Kitasatospora sp. NPDC004531]
MPAAPPVRGGTECASPSRASAPSPPPRSTCPPPPERPRSAQATSGHRDIAAFLTTGQYTARDTDNRLAVTRIMSTGGPEVHAAAQAALSGPVSRLGALPAVGLPKAQQRDAVTAAHVVTIASYLQDAGGGTALARQHAAEAAEFYATARGAANEAGGHAEQAQASAAEADEWAVKAAESARQAKEAADKAAAYAAQARAFAVSADAAARSADYSVSSAGPPGRDRRQGNR